MTFAWFTLCTRRGEVATLERVRWDLAEREATLEPYLRFIPPEAERTAPRGYDPAVLRAAPGSKHLLGRWTEGITGTQIQARCARPVPSRERTDLAIVMTAGAAGARVDGFEVDYTAEGRRYTLRVDYALVMCPRAEPRGCRWPADPPED